MKLNQVIHSLLPDRPRPGVLLVAFIFLGACGDSARPGGDPWDDAATYTGRFVGALAQGYEQSASGLPDLVLQTDVYTPPPFTEPATLKYLLYEAAVVYFDAVLPEMDEDERNFFYEAFRLSYLWESEIAREKKTLGPWYAQSDEYRGDTDFAAYTSAVGDVAILMACRWLAEQSPDSSMLSLLFFGAYQELFFEKRAGNLWYQYPPSGFNPKWASLYRGGEGPGRGVDVPITLIPQAVWVALALDARQMLEQGAPPASPATQQLWTNAARYRAEALEYVEELQSQEPPATGALLEALLGILRREETVDAVLRDLVVALQPRPTVDRTDAEWKAWAAGTTDEITRALRRSTEANLAGDAPPVLVTVPEFTRLMAALGFPERLQSAAGNASSERGRRSAGP